LSAALPKTPRAEDELNAREILTLELAILSERKIAKVIELLEELRRDSPRVVDRADQQPERMAQPAGAQSVRRRAGKRSIEPKVTTTNATLPASGSERKPHLSRSAGATASSPPHSLFRGSRNAHSLRL
jgi:hypothetical protein